MPLNGWPYVSVDGGSLPGRWPRSATAGLLITVSPFAALTTVGAPMGTIPPEKAGVGSALNGIVQQSGAALGVAILGSLLASGYTCPSARSPGLARTSAMRSARLHRIARTGTGLGGLSLCEAVRNPCASWGTSVMIGSVVAAGHGCPEPA